MLANAATLLVPPAVVPGISVTAPVFRGSSAFVGQGNSTAFHHPGGGVFAAAFAMPPQQDRATVLVNHGHDDHGIGGVSGDNNDVNEGDGGVAAAVIESVGILERQDIGTLLRDATTRQHATPASSPVRSGTSPPPSSLWPLRVVGAPASAGNDSASATATNLDVGHAYDGQDHPMGVFRRRNAHGLAGAPTAPLPSTKTPATGATTTYRDSAQPYNNCLLYTSDAADE